jgi:hypothetical protein
LDYFLDQRTTTDWVGYLVRDGAFEGNGGAGNLFEVLTYFLDEFLPQNIDPEFTYPLHLPMLEHEGQLRLIADAIVMSESELRIVSLSNPLLPNSYEWNLSAEPALLHHIESTLSELHPAYEIGDVVEPIIYQSPDNMLRTFLVAPVKNDA